MACMAVKGVKHTCAGSLPNQIEVQSVRLCFSFVQIMSHLHLVSSQMSGLGREMETLRVGGLIFEPLSVMFYV